MEIRSFDYNTGKLETLVLDEGHSSTESFLCQYYVSFAETGQISYCKNIGNFILDDVHHMGGMCNLKIIARKFGCKFYDSQPLPKSPTSSAQ